MLNFWNDGFGRSMLTTTYKKFEKGKKKKFWKRNLSHKLWWIFTYDFGFNFFMFIFNTSMSFKLQTDLQFLWELKYNGLIFEVNTKNNGDITLNQNIEVYSDTNIEVYSDLILVSLILNKLTLQILISNF